MSNTCPWVRYEGIIRLNGRNCWYCSAIELVVNGAISRFRGAIQRYGTAKCAYLLVWICDTAVEILVNMGRVAIRRYDAV